MFGIINDSGCLFWLTNRDYLLYSIFLQMRERIAYEDEYLEEERSEVYLRVSSDGSDPRIELNIPDGTYPDVIPRSTDARPMLRMGSVPTQRILDVQDSIEGFAGSDQGLKKILNGEYSAGLARYSVENTSHYGDVPNKMAVDGVFHDLVLGALKNNTPLQESLYRGMRGEATPAQKIHLLRELPGLDCTEIGRRSFSFDGNSRELDDAMYREVDEAIEAAGGIVYYEPLLTKEPKLHVVATPEGDNQRRFYYAVFTAKHDIGMVSRVGAEEPDITVRVRDKFLVKVTDDDMMRHVKRGFEHAKEHDDRVHILQENKDFIAHLYGLVDDEETIKLSSIVYGYVSRKNVGEDIQVSTWAEAAEEIVEESRHSIAIYDASKQMEAPDSENDTNETLGSDEMPEDDIEYQRRLELQLYADRRMVDAELGAKAFIESQKSSTLSPELEQELTGPDIYELVVAAFIRAHKGLGSSR